MRVYILRTLLADSSDHAQYFRPRKQVYYVENYHRRKRYRQDEDTCGDGKYTAEQSEGSVVCPEKGEKLRYDVTYKARLVNTDEYAISDGEELYGFVAGIHASNHDITHIFIDSALKICRNNLAELDSFVAEMASLCDSHEIDVVMTCSLAESEASEIVKKYC